MTIYAVKINAFGVPYIDKGEETNHTGHKITVKFAEYEIYEDTDVGKTLFYTEDEAVEACFKLIRRK